MLRSISSDDRSLLSTAEAKKVCDLSQEYLQRLLSHGRLEGFKVGHDWLVFEDSLKTFLATPRKRGRRPRAAKPADTSIME